MYMRWVIMVQPPLFLHFFLSLPAVFIAIICSTIDQVETNSSPRLNVPLYHDPGLFQSKMHTKLWYHKPITGISVTRRYRVFGKIYIQHKKKRHYLLVQIFFLGFFMPASFRFKRIQIIHP